MGERGRKTSVWRAFRSAFFEENYGQSGPDMWGPREGGTSSGPGRRKRLLTGAFKSAGVTPQSLRQGRLLRTGILLFLALDVAIVIFLVVWFLL